MIFTIVTVKIVIAAAEKLYIFYKNPQCSLSCCVDVFSIADEIDNQVAADQTDWGSALQHSDNVETVNITEVVCDMEMDEGKDSDGEGFSLPEKGCNRNHFKTK